MKAVRLKTEYLQDPLGIDIPHPRLFWTCEDGITQSAFQILAATDGRTVWDSGKVTSGSMHADYPNALASRQRVSWRVRLWDENDDPGAWSSEAFFEMGLLNASDWSALWIAGDYPVRKKQRYPVDCFRKVFSAGQVQKARLYLTACGLYEARLNGRRVGDALLTPGSTDYRKRIQYQVYDVTDLLRGGENAMTVELADGWYRGSNGGAGQTNTFGTQTKLLAQLELTLADGTTQTVCSDGSWAWSNDGPIRFADLKDGEIVDANREPSYSGGVRVVEEHAPLTASDNVPVLERERFAPVERITTPSGKTVLKYAQNLSGYVSFRVTAHKGQRVHITMGETLDDSGELTLRNIQCITKGRPSPLQELDYTCREGVNEYTPKFYYGGFQYAQVDTDVEFRTEDFTAVAVYSAFEETSKFECSNRLINQFYHNTLWSLKSNSTDVPTDCPTRERMGWTGDSQVFFNTASYLTDYAAFARKHVRDIFDRQWRSGRLPQIAPFANESPSINKMNGSVGWACAGVYIPYYFYQKYGDDRLLRAYYDNMLRYADFMIRRAGKWGGIFAKPMHLSHKIESMLLTAASPTASGPSRMTSWPSTGSTFHSAPGGIHGLYIFYAQACAGDRLDPRQAGNAAAGAHPGIQRGREMRLSGTRYEGRLLAGYRPAGQARPALVYGAADAGAGDLCQKAPHCRAGPLWLASRDRLPLHADDPGRSGGAGYQLCLPSAGKRGNARLALYAEVRRNDDLGGLGGQPEGQMDRLAEPLFQRRGLRVADEHDVRHPDHRRKPCYNCTEARRGHHLRTG